MIDLQKFCAKDRPPLDAPFTSGEHTYATNGHIVVRVPKRAEVEASVPENTVQKINFYFQETLKASGPMLPIPDGEIPARESRPCDWCDGEGQLDHCPTCHQPCDCPECGGEGRRWLDPVGVEIAPGAVVSSHCLSWLKELPSPRFRVTKIDHRGLATIYFDFDGGDGILMGRFPNRSSDISLCKKDATA